MIAKSLIATVLVSGITFFTGCSNMEKSDSMGMKSSMLSSNPKENVVIITGAHGGTATFAYDQASGKAKMTKMAGDMKECPSCMKEVDGYFTSGKMTEVCKDCGARHIGAAAAHSGHG